MKSPAALFAGLLFLLCDEAGTTRSPTGTTKLPESAWLHEGDVVDIKERLMKNGEDFAISLSFNGKTVVYTGKRLKPAKKQTPTKEVEPVELDDCVRTAYNKNGELVQLYDGCTYFSGGILETNNGFFELDIVKSGNKKKATLKKVKRTEELKKKMKDKEPRMNPDYAKWLEENKGSL